MTGIFPAFGVRSGLSTMSSCKELPHDLIAIIQIRNTRRSLYRGAGGNSGLPNTVNTHVDVETPELSQQRGGTQEYLQFRADPQSAGLPHRWSTSREPPLV